MPSSPKHTGKLSKFVRKFKPSKRGKKSVPPEESEWLDSHPGHPGQLVELPQSHSSSGAPSGGGFAPPSSPYAGASDPEALALAWGNQPSGGVAWNSVQWGGPGSYADSSNAAFSPEMLQWNHQTEPMGYGVSTDDPFEVLKDQVASLSVHLSSMNWTPGRFLDDLLVFSGPAPADETGVGRGQEWTEWKKLLEGLTNSDLPDVAAAAAKILCSSDYTTNT